MACGLPLSDHDICIPPVSYPTVLCGLELRIRNRPAEALGMSGIS